MYKPRWNGKKWIEEGEFPEPLPPEPTTPSLEEQIKALSSAVLEMAGVIYG